MKTRFRILLILVGAFTLSFTVVTVRENQDKPQQSNVENSQSEPIGGFASADKLEF